MPIHTCIRDTCTHSLVPRPCLPEKERAWYPLLAHARNYLRQDKGGGAYDAEHADGVMLYQNEIDRSGISPETTRQLALYCPGLLAIPVNLRSMTNGNPSYHTDILNLVGEPCKIVFLCANSQNRGCLFQLETRTGVHRSALSH